MKNKLKAIISAGLLTAHKQGLLPATDFPEILIDIPRVASHGDYSTNIAMMSAAKQKMAPRKIAGAIVAGIIDKENIIAKIDIAGPGFINFHLRPMAWQPVLRRIHEQDKQYGASAHGNGIRIQVEFVSSNPTGPLHVGHGRGAAVGDSLANILAFSGYNVQREYYINDSGRQIHTLGRSVYLRYLALTGRKIDFPDDCYQGEYIRTFADEIKRDRDCDLLEMPEEDAVMFCARFATEKILADIRDDLEQFGVTFDRWFSEQSLYDDGRVDRILESLRDRNLVYREDGATWFRTTDFGDEKDRVVVRKNGQTTYLASDIAYHHEKFERGFHRVIDVWGADHHGYIARMNAAVEATGQKRDQFDVVLVRLVNLLRDGEPVAMSTRAGKFITLKDVVSEVGRDAARFIFLSRHHDSALDFDLEVAKKKSNDNPVYYVQYVHARIASILSKSRERGLQADTFNQSDLAFISEKEEVSLMKRMANFPEIVLRSAEQMAPHHITFYLMDLAGAFHTYYNKHRILTDSAAKSRGRLYLVMAIQKIIRNGLTLLGVTAPDRM